HLNFCKALTAGLLAHEPPLLSRRGPPLPGPLLQRRRGRRRRPFYCIGQRVTSPSPPLEERAGERRAFIRKRWDFLVRSTSLAVSRAPFTCTKSEMCPQPA